MIAETVELGLSISIFWHQQLVLNTFAVAYTNQIGVNKKLKIQNTILPTSIAVAYTNLLLVVVFNKKLTGLEKKEKAEGRSRSLYEEFLPDYIHTDYIL